MSRRPQIEKNTTSHSTIGMTPYEALYNRGIPVELALEIPEDPPQEFLMLNQRKNYR